MAGFDGSVFDKPLDAEEKAKKPATFKEWVSEKYTAVKCKFSQMCCGR